MILSLAYFTFMLVLLPLQAVSKEAPSQIEGVRVIDVAQAAFLYSQGAVFIDVRKASDYRIGHIEGSVHLDFSEDEFVLLYISGSLARDTPVVFYSESPLVNSGAMASYFAAAWGYENVYFFRDGFYAWLAVDHPTTLGDPSQAEMMGDESQYSVEML